MLVSYLSIICYSTYNDEIPTFHLILELVFHEIVNYERQLTVKLLT